MRSDVPHPGEGQPGQPHDDGSAVLQRHAEPPAAGRGAGGIQRAAPHAHLPPLRGYWLQGVTPDANCGPTVEADSIALTVYDPFSQAVSTRCMQLARPNAPLHVMAAGSCLYEVHTSQKEPWASVEQSPTGRSIILHCKLCRVFLQVTAAFRCKCGRIPPAYSFPLALLAVGCYNCATLHSIAFTADDSPERSWSTSGSACLDALLSIMLIWNICF